MPVGQCHFRNNQEKRRQVAEFLTKHGDKLPPEAVRKATSKELINNWALRCDGKKVVSGVKQMGAVSFDEVINKLATSKVGVPDSLFGVCRSSRRFVREKEDEIRF